MYSINISNKAVISPNFSETDIETLKHYFEFNKRYYDTINNELRLELLEHPVFGPLIKMQTKDQQKEQNERSLELERAAIFDGKWDEYSKDLIAQGITYAKMNISYMDWYGLIKIYKDKLIRHIKNDFPASEQAIHFIEGLTKFLDYAMYGIAEAYFAEKNNIIRANEERFRAIFEHSVDNILLIDKNLIIVMINHDAGRFKKEEIIGKSLLDIQQPENIESLKNAIDSVLKNKTSIIFETEVTIEGEKIYYSSSFSPIFNSIGEVYNLIFISRDITAQKKAEIETKDMNAALEIKVNERTTELLRSNKELEQFAYISSHDLQEPLRTVVNYTDLLLKQYKGKLDKDADEYLDFIGEATKRMQELIRDLLDFSRIGKNKNKMEVDCDKLLIEILKDLDSSIKESNTEIHSEPLPILYGYYAELKSLFQNLISNAIKFRKKDIHPIISITVKDKDTEWLFAIKDNGIGIDKKYYDKLFTIFQRLHNKEEYAGTGIGLAQSKKIVELHDGKIWLESELGKGSSFYFTIHKTKL
jgi:PAS domain S-box-containing protein